jgi:alpha-tubulin suppressor-like RCC1 family protein
VGEVNVGGLVKQLSAGDYHTCALLETGNVRCWGYNWHGQLGYGHTAQVGDNETPASAGDIAVGDTVLQIIASMGDEQHGRSHTCALLSTGGVKCWGYNGQGQLGYGNTAGLNQPSTSTVDLGGASAYTLSAGGFHTCALLSTGKARCWGYNGHGQLGYANTTQIGDNELPSAAGDIQVVAP